MSLVEHDGARRGRRAASLLGALVFAEPVDLWVLVGGAVMIGAISYITWREAHLRRPSPAAAALPSEGRGGA